MLRLVFLATCLSSAALAPAQVSYLRDEGQFRYQLGNGDLVSFETVNGSVNTQYPGVVFSSFAGGDPRTSGYQYRGIRGFDTNPGATAGGGGVRLDFARPVRAFGFWALDIEFPDSTIRFLDGNGQQIANLAVQIDGPTQWGFHGFVHTSATISRIEIAWDIRDYVALDELKFSPGAPGEAWSVPETLTTQLGRVTAGSVVSLASFDGQPLTACKFFVPNAQSPVVQLVFDGHTTVTNPALYRTKARSKLVSAGVFLHATDAYRFSDQQFVNVHTDSITTTYRFFDFTVIQNAGSYVGPNGELRARVRLLQTGPSTALTPCFDMDSFEWYLTP